MLLMKKNTETFILTLIILLMTGCSDITRELVNIKLDMIPPVIHNIKPGVNSYCANIVEIAGYITDTGVADTVNTRIKSLTYSVANFITDESAALNADNSYSFCLETTRLPGQFVLELKATDLNGNVAYLSLPLFKAENAFPGFTATADSRQILLNWEPVPKALNYRLCYSDNGLPPAGEGGIILPADVNSYKLENVIKGNLYTFRLTVNAETGWPGGSSDNLQAIPLSPLTLAPRVMGEYRQIRLDWNAISATMKYEVYRALQREGPYSNISGVIYENCYVDRTINAETTYYYKIKPNLPGTSKSAAGSGRCYNLPVGYPATGSCPTGDYAIDIEVAGDYAFIADYDGGIYSIDISDPDSPREKSHWPLSDTAIAIIAIAANDEYVYAAEQNGTLYGFAISDSGLQNVSEVYNTWNGNEIQDIFMAGTDVFIAEIDLGSTVLTILDISDPFHPALISTSTTPGAVEGIAVGGGYVYEAKGENGLQVIDISDRSQPVLTGALDTDGYAENLCLAGDELFVADGEAGILAVDITDPFHPQKLCTIDTPGYAEDCCVSGNTLIVADGSENVRFFALPGTGNTQPDNFHYLPGYTEKVVVKGQTMYVANGYCGIQVIKMPGSLVNYETQYVLQEFNNPSAISVSGDIICLVDNEDTVKIYTAASGTPCQAAVFKHPDGKKITAISVYDHFLYILDETSALLIIDVSRPDSPALNNRLAVPGTACELTINGDYAYVAAGKEGIQIIDISDPLRLRTVGNINTAGNANDIVVQGKYAYIADGPSGLQVYDVSNPCSPHIASFWDTRGYAKKIQVNDAYVFLASGESDLEIFSIANPAYILGAETFSAGGVINNLEIQENIACLATDKGIHVMDISCPGYIYTLFSLETPGCVYDITARGNNLYLADKTAGLIILKLKDESPGQ